ncbi:MAG: arylesterase, partial [Rubricella sp.]
IAVERGLPVMLIGLPAPGNYGPEFREAFNAMYPDLAAEYDAIHVENFLAALEAEAATDRARAVQALMQPDGIHPNARGVGLIVEDLGPRVQQLIDRVE